MLSRKLKIYNLVDLHVQCVTCNIYVLVRNFHEANNYMNCAGKETIYNNWGKCMVASFDTVILQSNIITFTLRVITQLRKLQCEWHNY